MSTCLFDSFPVELVHNIFHYLWAHEIFYGFTRLSSYIDNVLVGYDRYSISLSSMVKHQFDLMCLHIRPEQVISITITENNDTPNQSEIFFSKFDILQFINLRSFSIISSNQNGRLMMEKMHQFLLKMPCLMHFELRIDDPIHFVVGDQWKVWSQSSEVDIEDATDIIDGNQWKYLVSHLQIFDFRFCLADRLNKQILDSFRTSFWLTQKKWFVAYDDLQSSSCLFTVPRFAPKNIIYLLNYDTPSCTSSELCLDQYVDILNLPTVRPLMHHFINVTSLILQTDKDLCLDRILPYLALPQLKSLSLVNTSLLTQLSTETRFESIRSLMIDTLEIKSHAEQICILFPRIERLKIGINDQETMLLLIDRLKHLSLVTFIYHQPSMFTNISYE
ncbi:unnamed protein product, partial [Rotaria sp. Silwood1]